jgi:hypothetical protein
MITTPFQNTLYLGISMFILLLSVAIIVVGIILIHELPYRIAKRRGHPQQDAIRCMAIMGLILLPLWLFAMIWAYMCSGVSYFGGTLDNDKKLPIDGAGSDIEPENESKMDNSDAKTEDDEIKIVDSDVLIGEKELDSVEPDEDKLNGSNKKTVDNKDDNIGN